MKQKAILIIALLALVLMMITPVSAALIPTPNTSTIVYAGDTLSVIRTAGTSARLYKSIGPYSNSVELGVAKTESPAVWVLPNISAPYNYYLVVELNVGTEISHASFQWGGNVNPGLVVYNITYSVKNLAGTPLGNVRIETISDRDSEITYTNISGNTSQSILALSTNAEVFANAGGLYNPYSVFFSLSEGLHQNIYLEQSIGNGTPLRNITYNFFNSVGSPLTGVSYNHTISAGSQIEGNTGGINSITLFQILVYYDAGYILASKSGYQNYMSFFSFTGDMIKNITMLSVTDPTPTIPTITPTPAPTIPAGYIRTEIATIDVFGARISGTNINILDNEVGVWTNSTNDADGLSSVITLPYHTLNVYGSYTQVANEYANNSLIGINTGFDGGIRFYLILYPYYADTGVGNTRVYITVMESAGLAPISNVLVKVGILNNATQVGYTSSGGVQAFTVPNQTVLHITAEKPGYITNGIVINSGTGTTAFANIVLDRRTVTPTVTQTIIPGETTVRPTQDPNDPFLHGGDTSFKAQEMMNWLAMNGMSLVQLCFLVTVFTLLGVKLGKR